MAGKRSSTGCFNCCAVPEAMPEHWMSSDAMPPTSAQRRAERVAARKRSATVRQRSGPLAERVAPETGSSSHPLPSDTLACRHAPEVKTVCRKTTRKLVSRRTMEAHVPTATPGRCPGPRSGQRAAGQHADADDADAGSFAISNDSELVGALVVTIVWNQNPPISLEHSTLILKKLRNSASCPVEGLAFFSEWVPVGAVMFSSAGSASRP